MRPTPRPWRSWSVIALVLIGLALAQACGKSGSSTGPSTGSALQLRLRQVSGAQLPAGCSGGTFLFTAPGQPPVSGSFGADGRISVQLTVDVTYTLTVTINCQGLGPQTGSITFHVLPGGVAREIVITVSQVSGVVCSPSSVATNEESTCTCNASGPNASSITWTGPVSPTTGTTVRFRQANPGTYDVSCAISGLGTQQTTVNVRATEEPPTPPPPPPPPPPRTTGTLRVTNTSDPSCTFCTIDVTFDSPAIATITNLAPGRSVTRSNIPPGNYTATPDCAQDIPFTIQAGQTTQVNVAGNCG